MERILLQGADARMTVKTGVDKGADAVRHTLGPFGTNALIEKGNRITNDGQTILKELTLEDEAENLGLSKLKEGVAKSNDQVGDASTTIAILTQEILKESQRLLGTDKTIGGRMTTASFIRKIRSECDEVVTKLSEVVTPITSEQDLISSAIVSVEDEELGRIIGEAQWKLGSEGYLLAEEGEDKTTTVEHVQGVKTDNGFASQAFANDHENEAINVIDTHVILTSHTLQSLEPLKDILDSLLKQKVRSIAIVARGFSEQAVKDCAANVANGFYIFPVNAPYTDSKEVMLDLATVLGGTFIDHEARDLEDMQLSDVGFAEKVFVKRFTSIFTGASKPEAVAERVAVLKEKLAGSGSDFEKKLLSSRIAQLEHGFAIVKVGAESETERKRVFDKVEDAVNAVRSALQEGTVPGAGLAFKAIAEGFDDSYILKRPLMSIHNQLMANAPDDFVVEDWVRDPFKVLRIALEQAVSVGAGLATVNTVIVTKKQKYNAFIPKD